MALYGTTRAELRVADDLPPGLAFGPFRAGAVLRTAVRYSNAASKTESDLVPGRQGLALKITDDQGHTQDLLTTTGAAEFLAENGAAAIAAAKAEMKGPLGIIGLAVKIGVLNAARLVYAAKSTANHGKSVPGQMLFSRVPYQLGEFAVKFRLVPVGDVDEPWLGEGQHARTDDIRRRLDTGPLVYNLQVQGKPEQVSLDDAREEWSGTAYVTLAQLVIPRQPRNDAAQDLDQVGVNKLSFSPFHRWDDKDDRALKPLRDVNATRKAVYEASAKARGSGGADTVRCPYGFG